MLKKKILSKIIVTTIALCSLYMLYIIPNTNNYTLKNVKEKLVYEEEKGNSQMYLIDKNDYVARTIVKIDNTDDINQKANELLDILIIEGKKEEKVPNGFKAIIPEGTKILALTYKDNILKVDFSSEFLDISKEKEEKMIEAIVYTLTSIKEVKGVIIYVEGEILSKLPKTGINLPSTLDRSFGINKEYDFTSLSNINDVTIYYISKYNDSYYYVPVTKYINDDEEKIKIIIDELASGPTYQTNLMSFLNSNTEVLSSNIVDNTLELTFNNYIFSDIENKKILEEVMYTICLSIEDNYDVENVSINVDNEQIYKSVLKTIE